MNYTGGMTAPSLSAGKQNNDRFWYFESIFLHTKALQSSEIQYELFNVVWNYIISVMKIEENQGKLRKIDWPAIRFLRKLQSWWHTWGAAFLWASIQKFKTSSTVRGYIYSNFMCLLWKLYKIFDTAEIYEKPAWNHENHEKRPGTMTNQPGSIKNHENIINS